MAAPVETAEARPKSRRRSRSRGDKAAGEEAEPSAAAAPRSPFGEVIDVTEEPASQIVEVPESDAPQRRSRPRVRQPAATVPAEVVTATIAELQPAPEPVAVDAAPDEPAEAGPEAEAALPAEASQEAASEPELETSAAEPASTASEFEAPKRRGWWSRALSGS